MPTNLDQPGSHRRTHEKTDFLLQNFDPGILWDNFGIRADIVVHLPLQALPIFHFPSEAILISHSLILSLAPIFTNS